ncbi:MAG: hypothetical protein HC831_00015 [Chloroflexia bacterium]|nr:hypothetical protein [Chloroflexia bacterium]
MKLILTFTFLISCMAMNSQTFDSKTAGKFLFIAVDTLHVHPDLVFKNESIKIKNNKNLEEEFHPAYWFYFDKAKHYNAYLLVSDEKKMADLIIEQSKTKAVVFNETIAIYSLLVGAYEKWQNAWITDFNNDGNLDIGIYNRLIDFELPTEESENISADEKYILLFKDGKFHRKEWDDNILMRYQLQPNRKEMKSKEITITGTALNAKLGAVIQTESGEIYYLTDIYEWPDEAINKKIKVTGSISSEYYDPKDLKTKEGAYKTGMSGEKVNIKNAKWEIVE